MLDQITPLILTYNEAPNLPRVLDRLSWAEEIVVIDSGSDDDTLAILESHPAVRVHVRPSFPHITDQWNFGLDQINTPWVLTLDADYVLSEALVAELGNLQPTADGYAAGFRYCIGGRPLRGTLYPDRTILFRTSAGRYVEDGHTQLLALNGVMARLRHPVHHDDRKPLSRWLDNQRRYTALEAEKLLAAEPPDLSRADRLRRRALAPAIVPFYCLFAKGLILDGAAGWRYTLERTYAEVLLALELTQRRLTGGGP